MYVCVCVEGCREGYRLHRQNALERDGVQGSLGNKRYTKHSGEKRKERKRGSKKKDERNKSSMSSKRQTKRNAAFSRVFFFFLFLISQHHPFFPLLPLLSFLASFTRSLVVVSTRFFFSRVPHVSLAHRFLGGVAVRGGVTGRPEFMPPYWYLAFFSEGFRI